MDLIQGYSAFFICQRHASNLQTAHVALKYKKHEGVELPKDASLATFCFPVVSEMHITKRVNAPEVFCFTMTGDTGDRVHGFCRKIYWSSAAKFPKFPIVLCILSDELWSVFYYKVNTSIFKLECLLGFGNLGTAFASRKVLFNPAKLNFSPKISSGAIPGRN